MRVLLVRPHNIGNVNTRLPESLNKRQGVLPPLGISYIASTLEAAGHTVQILDAIAMNLVVDDIRRQIQEFGPDVVGVTAMTSTLFGALEAAKIAKEIGSITVLGGSQLSIYPKETLAYPYVDYGVNGEGETVLLELANALEKKSPVENIKGLIYKDAGGIHVNEPVIVEDLDALPFPAYHLLPMNKYSSIIGLHPTSTMVSTRGCPYQCHFCSKQPSDKKLRFRSPEKVVDEMQFLVERYKVREIMFYDDVITASRKHIGGICEEILSRGLKVHWETPSRVNDVDKTILNLMHRAGCLRVRYGIESGNESTLKLMNKKIDLKQAKEALKLTRAEGMETFAYFMVGYAHETPKTILETINFAIQLNPDLVMFTVVTPYPGTPLYSLALKEGLIKTDYWREFAQGHTGERIPYFVPNADRWLQKAYRQFYLRPGYLFGRVLKIRSLDSLKKHFHALQGILSFKMEAD
jgi:anaerobic magnesium-protoporphyrin IX monomethyl ester cyclase